MAKNDIQEQAQTTTRAIDPIENQAAQFVSEAGKPRYDQRNSGVYWITPKDDGTEKEHRLCDAIDILGNGFDANSDAYRIIRYTSKETGKREIFALPCAEIGYNWKILQRRGIVVQAGKLNRERLTDFLQTQGGKEQWHIAKKTGWHNGAYILPNGEVIAPESQAAPKVCFNGNRDLIESYTAKSSLHQWRENVARYANGNSRLLLAIGTALAAPLLERLNENSGGFHIYGDSTDGKTTAGFVGLSVWANHNGKQTWKATPYAITNAACTRNDGFLFLDEIAQAKAHEVAESAYNLGNGQGKLQGDKDGGNRPEIRFKTLFFSTGEKSIESYVKQRNPELWQAGQAVRLPSIPSDAGKGLNLFDTIHGFADTWTFANTLSENSHKFSGVAGVEFIKAMMRDSDHMTAITQYIKNFETALPLGLGNQAKRVSRRFAIVAAALELATQYGITGFIAGVGQAGVMQCFNDWLDQHGKGNHEDRALIEQAMNFFAMHGFGERFTENTSMEATNHNHAGFYENTKPRTFYVIEPVMQNEIAQTYDIKKAVAVLERAKWFIRGDRGNGKTPKSFKGERRDYYCFVGIAPPNWQDE